MPYLISNMVAKGFTPYTARLAPKSQWARPQLGRQPQKTTRFASDPTVKATWRFIRRWVCHNHKLYYSYVILCAILVYNIWWQAVIGYYRKRNYHRSLPYAIPKEKEWQLIKPKDDDEWDDEEETTEGGEEAAEE